MQKNNQLQFLKNSVKTGHLSHAYLFFGGTRQEKKDTAVDFALELTGCKGKWNADPDIFLIGIQEAEKITKEEDGDLDILEYWTALLHDMIYLVSGCDELISNQANISEMRELAEKKQYSLEQLHSILSEI